MTPEQAIEALRMLAEASKACHESPSLQTHFDLANLVEITDFPALLEAVEGLVRDVKKYKDFALSLAFPLDPEPTFEQFQEAVRLRAERTITSQTPGAAGE